MKAKNESQRKTRKYYVIGVLIIAVVGFFIYFLYLDAVNSTYMQPYLQPTPTGFSGFNIPYGGWTFTSDGKLTILIKNIQGNAIEIVGFNTTQGKITVQNTTMNGNPGVPYLRLGPGASTVLKVGGLQGSLGAAYSVSVVIYYNNIDIGKKYLKSTGTLTGYIIEPY